MKIIPLFLVFCCALSARADEDRYRDLPQLGGPQGISGGKVMSIGGKGVHLEYLLNKNGEGSFSLRSEPRRTHIQMFGGTLTGESRFKIQRNQLILEFKF
ncbi:MAG: hypothetical protein A2675_03455 [Candidatus Yonathbacteria bacterium RIFCSPHIGHO2_01_FULL_51_10]|uniref:Uncharacterized protein n=1 Tax=Candidatus Yonathbacteria bacterium RIFCSPHIGHO2_01_FULL_51_10 TaxID=1802723 RepID=A0A1G2S9W6_9BACT|nr:MAG: hypothetical protein A2675_03455 [Candidatus Yonathbacteria bacterium RIFCSPHIGHO2_01_FULL_51_10]